MQWLAGQTALPSFLQDIVPGRSEPRRHNTRLRCFSASRLTFRFVGGGQGLELVRAVIPANVIVFVRVSSDSERVGACDALFLSPEFLASSTPRRLGAASHSWKHSAGPRTAPCRPRRRLAWTRRIPLAAIQPVPVESLVLQLEDFDRVLRRAQLVLYLALLIVASRGAASSPLSTAWTVSKRIRAMTRSIGAPRSSTYFLKGLAVPLLPMTRIAR